MVIVSRTSLTGRSVLEFGPRQKSIVSDANAFPRSLFVRPLGLAFTLLWATTALSSPAPLHQRIDARIDAGHIGTTGALTNDEDFLRRVHLDLTGRIPPAAELRAFLADKDPLKRSQRIDALLASPDHVRHLQTVFDVMLMERRSARQIGDAEWREYLYSSFRERKPYNRLAMEILRADAPAGPLRPATKFYLDRDGEVNALTRDVGRLFFGLDLECAQCHDHPSIDDYLQKNYYELFAFLSRSYQVEEKRSSLQLIAERADGEATFKSVFTDEEGQSQPRLPGGMELMDPKFHDGLYKRRPGEGMPGVPTYSRRERLAAAAGAGTNEAFARNIANRLWALMMGRGLVHPPDLHHSDNPATHPALLAELATALMDMEYDVSRFLGEIARSRTYQRASAPPPLAIDAKRASDLLQTRRQETEALRAAVEQAKTLWKKRETELKRAVDALAASDYTEATAAEAKAKDEVFGANAALVQGQRAVVEKEAALELARQAAELADAAAKSSEPQAEKLAETARNLRERATKLVAEVDKAREAFPALEAKIRTAELALPTAVARTSAVAASGRPLAANVTEHHRNADVAKRDFEAAKRGWEESRYAIEENELLVRALELVAERDAAQQAFSPVAERHGTLRGVLAKTREELAKMQAANTAAYDQASASEVTIEKTRTALAPKRQAAKLIDDAQKQVYSALEKLPDDKTLRTALASLEKESARATQEVKKLEATLAEATKKLESANKTIKSSEGTIAKAQTDADRIESEIDSFAAEFDSLKVVADKATIAATEAEKELLEVWRRRFAVASLKPLSPEQLGWSALRALGLVDRQLQKELGGTKSKDGSKTQDGIEIAFAAERATHKALRGKVDIFIRLYGGIPGSDEREFQATAQQALFMMNSGEIHGLLKPADDNLAAKLLQIEPAALADELYLSVLSRRPTAAETQTVTAYLESVADAATEEQSATTKKTTAHKTAAVEDLIWALLTSAEFRFNR